MYTLYTRDRNLNRTGEITNYIKLQLIPRFNDVGSFVLDINTNTIAASELLKDRSGIIVNKDGVTIFSGTITSRERNWTNDGDLMTFSGFDDNYYLSRNLAYPEINGNFGSQAYDIRSGNAETVIKQYVDYNIGQNAVTSRRLVTIESDQARGSVVTGRARFDKLIDLISSIALQGGGLGFNIIQSDTNLIFKVYQPTDKTTSVFFSPLFGNLIDFNYKLEDPQSNIVIIGGGGQGTSRIIEWTADNNSIIKYGRSEEFVDRRDTTDTTELTNSMNEELVNLGEKYSFKFTPIDTPQLSFVKDYNLGDKVSVVITRPNDEALDTIQDVVREVSITIDKDGSVIAPVIGTQDTNNNSIHGIFNKMSTLNKRISDLERRV